METKCKHFIKNQITLPKRIHIHRLDTITIALFYYYFLKRQCPYNIVYNVCCRPPRGTKKLRTINTFIEDI